MRYRLLGHTGLRVSELCLGSMTFGEDWGWGASKEEAFRMMEAFGEAGGNFIDTANHYTNGSSEKIVGEFVARDRDHWVVATKYTLNGRPDDPNAGGNHKKSMVRALEASLRRLGTDHIDLYWVHAWDPLTPMEETLRGLDDLVRAGKVLYLGISDTPAWVVARANTLAESRGWTRFDALQLPYSLVERTPERELLPMAKALEMTVTPWGILGTGVLTGKYAGGKREPGQRLTDTSWGAASLTPRKLAIGDATVAVAKEIGCAPSQVAIAWLKAQTHANIVPILGARNVKQLQDNLGALEVRLPEAALSTLEKASAIELGFPGDFLRQVEGIVYGKTRGLIDGQR